MGSDAGDSEAYADERPRHRVSVDAYEIDKYEVSNAQFKVFLDARGYERPELWSPAGWQWRTRINVTQSALWGDAASNTPPAGRRRVVV